MTMRPRGYMTLGEYEAQLKAEGKWDEHVACKQEHEATLRRKEEELAQAEAPILEALAEIGINVSAVWQLMGRPTAHDAQLVPVLLDHFRREYRHATREAIARALGRPEARSYWGVLIDLYREEREQHAKEGLAATIAAIATKDLIEDVITLANEQDNGESRVLLLGALARSRDPRARQALTELDEDPQLHEETQAILRRRRRSAR